MNRNARRLDRLTDWAIERQWTRHDEQSNSVHDDEDWQRLAAEYIDLAHSINEPPPITFKVHPRLVLFYCRKVGVTPDQCRDTLWRDMAVRATPAGRRLWRELQSIEARYDRQQDQQA